LTNNKPSPTVEVSYSADEGGAMELWSGIAWFLLLAITALRIFMVVGLLALIFYIIYGVHKRVLT